jgi:hypothetical protein
LKLPINSIHKLQSNPKIPFTLISQFFKTSIEKKEKKTSKRKTPGNYQTKLPNPPQTCRKSKKFAVVHLILPPKNAHETKQIISRGNGKARKNESKYLRKRNINEEILLKKSIHLIFVSIMELFTKLDVFLSFLLM